MFYQKTGIKLENIAFGSGSMGILRNICEFAIQEKSKVLGIAPQFPRFISEVELKKGLYEAYNLEKTENCKFSIDKFLNKINDSYSLVSIENPNNPTGQIIDITDIEKVVKKAKLNGALVVIDEAYGDYMNISNSAINLVSKYNNIIVIRSASKFYGLPNHRIGYLFASEELIKVYNKVALPFPFSDLSASIFINVLKRRNELENTKKAVIEVNKKIYRSLNSEDYLCTSLETPIFTLKQSKYSNLNEVLLKRGIKAEDCGYFLNLDSSYTRIRISKEYKQLIDVIKNL